MLTKPRVARRVSKMKKQQVQKFWGGIVHWRNPEVRIWLKLREGEGKWMGMSLEEQNDLMASGWDIARDNCNHPKGF